MNKEIMHADVNKLLNKEPKDLILDGVPMSFEQSQGKNLNKEMPPVLNQQIEKPVLKKGMNIDKTPDLAKDVLKKDEKPKQIERRKGTIDDIIKDAGSEKELDRIERKLGEGERVQFKVKPKDKEKGQEKEPVMTIERKDGNLIYKKDEKEITPEEFKKTVSKGKPEPDLQRISRELLEKEAERKKANERRQMAVRSENEFYANEYSEKKSEIDSYLEEKDESFFDELNDHMGKIHDAITDKEPDR